MNNDTTFACQYRLVICKDISFGTDGGRYDPINKRQNLRLLNPTSEKILQNKTDYRFHNLLVHKSI